MPTRALASWISSEDDDPDEEEDLVGVLESYTRELAALCGGMEVQQLVVEEKDRGEEAAGSPDTLTSLEEVTGECAALLACLEAAEHGLDEAVGSGDEGLDDSNGSDDSPDLEGDQDHQPQEDETNDKSRRQELVHELDSFADELKEFLSSLEEPAIEQNVVAPQAPASPLLEVSTCEQEVEEMKEIGDNDKIAGPVERQAATVASREGDGVDDSGNGGPSNAEEAHLSHKKEVFSERTKKAIALHVKRLALQQQCRRGNGFSISTRANAHDVEADTEQGLAGVKVAWSRFQSTSFHQHIMRQKFARRRVKQIQEARRLVETTRLRGTKGASCLRFAKSKSNECKASKRSEQRVTYLDQFKSTPSQMLHSAAFEQRYLCAVYLYGQRRLGTTFVTFNSLAQLEQRTKARFAIEDIASVYREVTEVVVPERTVGYRTTRRRQLKRFHRISSLEHVKDGDTLCVTQNAYDDMTILCGWIKRRQRVVHGFEYPVQQPSVSVVALTSEESTPPKAKLGGNTGCTLQIWDSNGRSIGVKTQPGI